MASKLKESVSFFLRWRAGDDHERLCTIQDHNHGKIQHRHRCESKTRRCVWGCVWDDIYVCIYISTSVRVVWWVEESFSNRKVASLIPCRSVLEQDTEPLIAPDVQCAISVNVKCVYSVSRSGVRRVGYKRL